MSLFRFRRCNGSFTRRRNGTQADAENVFDELKNQWSWIGFATQDLRRGQLMGRIVALVFNWWSLYVRLAVPGRHT